MPEGYHHLSYDKRCQIYALLKRDVPQKEIALVIGCSQSAISRELKRNRGKKGYRYKQAQEKTDCRKEKSINSRKKIKGKIEDRIREMLTLYQWSPEQISGRLKKEGANISHEAIYQYIWQDKHKGGFLYKHLRNKGKKYKSRSGKNAGRGVIPNRVGIENRPKIVDQKKRVGDWELDTIVGANHKGAIVSIVDRVTKITRLALLKRATAYNAAKAIIALLNPFAENVLTLTSDNGKEFAKHEFIASSLKADFYFAEPYSSWQRGLNENTNRLVRQYFPKGTDFTKLEKDDVKKIEYLLNTRPRKMLNFKTPAEEFYRRTKTVLNYALAG